MIMIFFPCPGLAPQCASATGAGGEINATNLCAIHLAGDTADGHGGDGDENGDCNHACDGVEDGSATAVQTVIMQSTLQVTMLMLLLNQMMVMVMIMVMMIMALQRR